MPSDGRRFFEKEEEGEETVSSTSDVEQCSSEIDETEWLGEGRIKNETWGSATSTFSDVVPHVSSRARARFYC